MPWTSLHRMHPIPWDRSVRTVTMIGWVVLLVSGPLAAPVAADHFDEGRYVCDGGYCRDGVDRTLDCRGGTCVGEAFGFTTITRPHFDDGAWLQEDDRVLGIVLNGDARAYPVRIMGTIFETVNDTIGGVPVIVSYCPLCGSGIVYSRVVDGRSMVFYNTGAIWKSDLVLYDLETRSEWTQIGGDAIRGPLHGTTLDIVPSQQIDWGEWRRAHPGTQVLARPVDEEGRPFTSYDHRSQDDPRRGTLATYSRVHGVVVEGAPVAIRIDRLQERGALPLEVGHHRLIAAYAGGDAHVFHAGTRQLSAGEEPGVLVDEDGNVYDVLTGKSETTYSLQRLPGRTTYWFAWRNFHPETEVVPAPPARAPGPGDAAVEEDVPLGLSVSLTALLLVAAAVQVRRDRHRWT